MLERMAQAIYHRGPDEDGSSCGPGWAWPRAGSASSAWPTAGSRSATRTAASPSSSTANCSTIPRRKAELERRGHQFRTHCDTELIPHLWEDHGEAMFEHCAASSPSPCGIERQQQLVLARDRFGICPLYWTRQTTPAANGCCSPRRSRRCWPPAWCRPGPIRAASITCSPSSPLPGPVTCFEGVQLLLPGRYLTIQPGWHGQPREVSEHVYWEIDFPDQGQEEPGFPPLGQQSPRPCRRIRGDSAAGRGAAAAGRRAGGVVPERRRRFQRGRGPGQQAAPAKAKADPDLHHLDPGSASSTRRTKRRPWPGTSAPSRSWSIAAGPRCCKPIPS